MAEPAETKPETGAPAPAAAEPADTKPETTAPAPTAEPVTPRDQTGRFQKRKTLGSLSDRMARLDAEERARGAAPAQDEPEDDEAGEGDDESAKPAAAAPKPDASAKPEPKASPDPTDKAIEKDLASKRVQFAEWKRGETEKIQARINLEYRQHQDRLHSERSAWEKQQQEWEPKITKADRILALMDSGDYEGLAKEAGHEDWDKFQSHVLGVVSDPNYKRVRAMERELEERKAKEKKDAEELTVRQQREQEEKTAREEHQKWVASVKAHKDGLSAKMAQSPDKLVRTMAKDRPFIEAVYAVQKEHWDPQTQSTLTPEQAIKRALRGAPKSLSEELQELRARLNEAFADDAPAVAAPEPAKPKAPKTGVVPAAATLEPAGSGKWTKKTWAEYSRKKMEEAAEEEEAARLAKRQARGR